MSNPTMNTSAAAPSSRLRLFTLSCLPVLLAACGTVKPVAFTQDEIKDRVVKDRQVIYADQEPVSAPIGFHEASARALKYNLDYRLKLLENALAQSLHDVSEHEMLPKLVASAGYVSRHNDSGGAPLASKTAWRRCVPRRRRSVTVRWRGCPFRGTRWISGCPITAPSRRPTSS